MFSEQSHKTKDKDKDGEVPFVLSDMSMDIFLPMLEFIYTNCCTLTSKNVSNVIYIDFPITTIKIKYKNE